MRCHDAHALFAKRQRVSADGRRKTGGPVLARSVHRKRSLVRIVPLRLMDDASDPPPLFTGFAGPSRLRTLWDKALGP